MYNNVFYPKHKNYYDKIYREKKIISSTIPFSFQITLLNIFMSPTGQQTYSGSLEIIPAEREVRPSLSVTTGRSVISAPTTSSSSISPTKNGVACEQKANDMHTQSRHSSSRTTPFQVHCCFY